jgi:hypothetical protein
MRCESAWLKRAVADCRRPFAPLAAMALPVDPMRRFNGLGSVVKKPRLALPMRHGI